MAKIAKPKMLKYPKKPKASASASVWERFDARVKEIDKENAAREARYKKELSHVHSDKKKKETLQKKYAGSLSGLAARRRKR